MNDFDEDEITDDEDEFSEDEVITEAEWREKYRPICEDYEAGNAKHEAIVSAKDPRFVWTEVMDWDRDRATLLPMFLPSGGDLLTGTCVKSPGPIPRVMMRARICTSSWITAKKKMKMTKTRF